MFLSEFSIKRPVAMIVIIIGLMALGLLALSKLRVNQIPDVEQPVLVVNIPYPGASPDTVEREVINRIEKALQGMAGVDQTARHRQRRQCAAGAVLQLRQEPGRGRRRGAQRHRLGALQAADRDPRADAAAHRPGGAAHHAAGAVVDLAQPRRDLAPGRRPAGRQVPRHPGRGRGQRQRRAQARAVGAAALGEAARVRGLGDRRGGGAARAERHRAGGQGARHAGRPEHPARRAASSSPSEFGQIVIKRRGDELVRLAQVATVQDGFAELSGFSVRNGNPNVGLSITRTREASTVSVADEIRDAGRRRWARRCPPARSWK